MDKYPNQRNITVNKQDCNKSNLYTINNLSAIDQAAGRLISKAGFKLYIYIAKNQNKYNFNLSSKDFMKWAYCQRTAYNTAFQQLVTQGYLIKKQNTDNCYMFYDKSQLNDDIINIEYANGKEINL